MHKDNWQNFCGSIRAFHGWVPEFYDAILKSYPNGDRKTPVRLDNTPFAVPVIGEVQVLEDQPAPYIRVKQTTKDGCLDITAPNIELLREAAEVAQDSDNNRTENRMCIQANEMKIQANEMKILDKQIELARLHSPDRGFFRGSARGDALVQAALISPVAKRQTNTTTSSGSYKKMKMDPTGGWDNTTH